MLSDVDIIKGIVRHIKKIEQLRVPHYELPADSFLEEIAENILFYVVHNS